MGTTDSLLDLLPATLRYERRELPPEQNALGPWQEAVACMHDLEDHDHTCAELIYGVGGQDDVRPAPIPTGEARERIDALLDENRRAFDFLDEGLARGRLQLPWPDTPNDAIGEKRNLVVNVAALSRLRFVRAKLLRAEGRLDEATAEFVAIWEMGRILCYGQCLVWECLAAGWLRNAGLKGLEHRELAGVISGEIADALHEESVRELATAGGLGNAMIIDLIAYDIPTLESISEGSAEEVLSSLLKAYYVDRTILSAIGDEGCEDSVPAEIQQQRVALRREQLLELMAGHPGLFDREDTVRLLGRALEGRVSLMSIDPSSRISRFWDRAAEWGFSQTGRRRRRFDLAWPPSLQPIPLEFFGHDKQAIASRELIPKLSQLAPPSPAALRRHRDRLLRIDNPVGRLIARDRDSTHALREFVWRYRRQLAATRRAIGRARRG
jgi:hypothetical protein